MSQLSRARLIRRLPLVRRLYDALARRDAALAATRANSDLILVRLAELRVVLRDEITSHANLILGRLAEVREEITSHTVRSLAEVREEITSHTVRSLAEVREEITSHTVRSLAEVREEITSHANLILRRLAEIREETAGNPELAERAEALATLAAAAERERDLAQARLDELRRNRHEECITQVDLILRRIAETREQESGTDIGLVQRAEALAILAATVECERDMLQAGLVELQAGQRDELIARVDLILRGIADVRDKIGADSAFAKQAEALDTHAASIERERDNSTGKA
jgi:hypothetical protein